MVRVEVGLAESWEMLAAAEDAGITHPAQEFASVDDDLLRVRRDGSRTHHRMRRLERKVERGSEVHVEAERAAVHANDASVLAEELAEAGGKDLRGRRSRTEHVAEAIYRSAFEVYTRKEQRCDLFLAIAQELMRLRSARDVAGKQDHSRRLDAREQGCETRIHLGAVEADDQELADGRTKILANLKRHCSIVTLLAREVSRTDHEFQDHR